MASTYPTYHAPVRHSRVASVANEPLQSDQSAECVVVDREDDAFIEWLASTMVARTPWEVCEVWRAQTRRGRRSRSLGSTTLKLTLAVAREKDCYSTMRARGHACPRCLANPVAAMMRKAALTTFAPGIALVGRAWLLGKTEVIDVPTAELSTYARAVAAAKAGLRTAVAVPVVNQLNTTAVVVTYFKDQESNIVSSMLRAARHAVDPEGKHNNDVTPLMDPADLKLAARLSSQSKRRKPAAFYPCPVCFATIDRAVRIRACAHSACADCLARWAVYSPDCPACGGYVDAVHLYPELDDLIHQDQDRPI